MLAERRRWKRALCYSGIGDERVRIVSVNEREAGKGSECGSGVSVVLIWLSVSLKCKQARLCRCLYRHLRSPVIVQRAKVSW